MNDEIESSDMRWIVARLGEDLNWWLESTSVREEPQEILLGVLDPRQVSHLAEALETYQPHGLKSEQVEAAFRLFSLESEIEEGRVRLGVNDEESFAGGEVFAMPLLEDGQSGPYFEFLEALAAARIRKLNADHHYSRQCTTEEMYEELDALDADRYFNADSMHSFDEISQILDWSPAEWDDPSES